MTNISKISAVLPLHISENDKSNSGDLIKILFSSLEKFAKPELFETFFIVCPKDQIPKISQLTEQWHNFTIKIIDEEDLIPELANYPTVGGWRKQQIIKLAIASIVKTPFYLTFDADIICTSPISVEKLIPGNKALLQQQERLTRAWWWGSSAHYININPNLNESGMDVTPAILSTQVCLNLVKHLENTGKCWIKRLLNPHRKYAWQRLNPRFKNQYSWTEYSLYYLFLEKNNEINTYHTICGTKEAPQRLLSNKNSVWNSTPFETWDPSIVFSNKDTSLFCVIQSNKNISPNVVWNRVKKYIT